MHACILVTSDIIRKRKGIAGANLEEVKPDRHSILLPWCLKCEHLKQEQNHFNIVCTIILQFSMGNHLVKRREQTNTKHVHTSKQHNLREDE